VQINGGSITFNDHIGQTTEVIDQLALEVLLPSLRKPLKVNGQIRYKLQTFKTDIVLETPAKAIEGETFNTDLSMNSDLVNVTYNGSVAQHPIAVEGKLSVAGDSVKQIALWQEVPMETKDNAFNQFSLDAAFTYSGNTFDMTELVARLDELDIKGNTTVYLESVPRIVSTVNLGDLNLNPYLPEPTEQAAPETTEATPIVWDDTPIDLSGLGAVNADLTITSSSLQTREVKLGANKFTLQMQDSVLNIAMEEFNAYEGKGVSKITVNGTRKPYRIDTDFDLSGIDFMPLLTDAAGFDKLMGKGQFKWQLSTSGESQKDFVEALNGSVNFDIKDGAVKGANLAAIAESAQEALTGNFAGVNLDQDYNNAQKTDFASLTGSIQFNDGVGNIKDVALLNPLIRVTAEGVANLPTTRLDMKSSTRLVASTQGQGGTTDESGIHIPIKIYGAFHDVKVKPDMSALFKDKAKEGLKDKVVDKLKGLFGGGD
jgi:AsmA protein